MVRQEGKAIKTMENSNKKSKKEVKLDLLANSLDKSSFEIQEILSLASSAQCAAGLKKKMNEEEKVNEKFDDGSKR